MRYESERRAEKLRDFEAALREERPTGRRQTQWEAEQLALASALESRHERTAFVAVEPKPAYAAWEIDLARAYHAKQAITHHTAASSPVVALI